MPVDLKPVEIVHDVPEAERTCPCGTPMVEIGCDVSEQLDIVPMQVRVLRHIRKRYGCPASVHAPVTAPLPPQPLPKSNAVNNDSKLIQFFLRQRFKTDTPPQSIERD